MPDRIVSDELNLLKRVNDALADAPTRKPPSEANLVDDLERIREQLVRGEMDFFERSALKHALEQPECVAGAAAKISGRTPSRPGIPLLRTHAAP